MPYESQIRRSNPASIVFLIDQSESMEDGIKGSQKPKKEGVAEVVNRFLHSLVIRCTVGRGEVYPYYHISVIGYGQSVGPAFGGKCEGQESVCISDLADAARIKTIRKEETDEVIRTPVWFDPTANGLTPMCHAFGQARRIVDKFLKQYPDCFPPMIVNVTDGDATDGDPQVEAANLRRMSSTDGNVLVFNVHVSSSNAPSVIFPSSNAQIQDPLAKQLFEMSSVLPEKMRMVAKELRFNIPDGARGFAFNADMACLTSLLEIGSRGQNTVARP